MGKKSKAVAVSLIDQTPLKSLFSSVDVLRKRYGNLFTLKNFQISYMPCAVKYLTIGDGIHTISLGHYPAGKCVSMYNALNRHETLWSEFEDHNIGAIKSPTFTPELRAMMEKYIAVTYDETNNICVSDAEIASFADKFNTKFAAGIA